MNPSGQRNDYFEDEQDDEDDSQTWESALRIGSIKPNRGLAVAAAHSRAMCIPVSFGFPHDANQHSCRLAFDPKRQILWPSKRPGRLRIRWPSRVHHQIVSLAGVPVARKSHERVGWRDFRAKPCSARAEESYKACVEPD